MEISNSVSMKYKMNDAANYIYFHALMKRITRTEEVTGVEAGDIYI